MSENHFKFQPFESHPAMRNKAKLPEAEVAKPEHLPDQLENEHYQAAREIARQGDFKNSLLTLKEKGLLEEQRNRLHEKYYAELEAATFLTNQDWEALTILELYDEGTFLHSLETYRIAKAKLENGFMFEGVEIKLDSMLKQEGLVSLEQFYRACLLHDIGKVEIPHFIITSEITHAEWAKMLVDLDNRNPDEKFLESALAQAGITLPPEITIRPAGAERNLLIVQLLMDRKVRCDQYVPLEEALNNPLLGTRAFSEKDLAALESRGFPNISRKTSFFEVVKVHEKKSFKILNDVLGLKKEAIMAGAHHDYDGSHTQLIENYPYTISSFHISAMLSEFLSVADMYQAIHDKRTYKNAESQLKTLSDLADNVLAKNNPKLCFVTYVWIGSDLKSIKELPEEHELMESLKNKLMNIHQKINKASGA